MNILVTGGAGYIGSHTCKILHKNNYKPITIDNLSTGNEWAVKWGPLIKGNINNQELIKSVINEYDIKAVIHFAANAYVGESIEHPRKYFNNNIINSLKFLNSVIDSKIKYFVFSSSCATYGIPKTIPIDENHQCKPINPYGETKLIFEKILKSYGNAYNLNWISLRYFNAAGADPNSEIGESHSPETHLIPLAIKCALKQKNELKIFGTDYPTPDGTAIRDYIHVDDLAAAHKLSIDKLVNGCKSKVINLGNEKGYSIYEIINVIEKISKSEIIKKETARRKGDPPSLIASSKKAKEILDWKPKYKTIEDIIKTAWEWELNKHSNIFNSEKY
ncbi:MAG: UDP-glucose 4-epimerase GalE [Pelagibacteraceae bacterium]|nr:UDP-glucose 4-epimerase GalE [Pelagibacteraceae bacterium]|tara:strand:- start:24603 stop:25601 length:999 start_codon:yes stop_codon:yes gene_type:complete